nr:MAG TPA: hypothetical protein [Caudoviricetes sp.]
MLPLWCFVVTSMLPTRFNDLQRSATVEDVI